MDVPNPTIIEQLHLPFGPRCQQVTTSCKGDRGEVVVRQGQGEGIGVGAWQGEVGGREVRM